MALAAVMAYRCEVFAGFFKAYGATVQELRARGLPIKAILALVAELPAGSPKWTRENELLASILDTLNQLTHSFVVVNTEKSARGKIKAPSPYPRPGEKPAAKAGDFAPTREFATPAEFDDWWNSKRPSSQSH